MVKSPALSRGSEILLKVAIAVISPLVLVGLLEGFAYLWERTQANGLYAWELVASRRIDLEPFFEPGAGYTLMKPYSQYEWQGIPLQINSHGLRGPEISYDKPVNTRRILNLGDSVAMGWGVREEDTYGRRLEQLLNEQETGAWHYEAINAGVPGWNFENALSYLEAEGLKYEPDLILLDMTIVNDVNGRSALPAHNGPPLLEWLRTNTYFWPFLTVQLRSLQARSEGRHRIDVIDPPTNSDKYFPRDPKAERWTEVWNRVLAIERLGKEHGAPIVLILFPLEYQVLDEKYSTLPQELLVARAAEAGIPVVDLLPLFREACQQKPGGACRLEDRYLFADVWMHPSAYGHELTANELMSIVSDMFVQ